MDEVLIEDRDGVRRIAFHRPETRNSLTVEMAGHVAEAVRAMADRDDLRVLVLTGEGGAFSSGADLKVLEAIQGSGDRAARAARVEAIQAMIVAVRNLPKPTIAAIDGAAAGISADLTFACDLRVGTPRAKFAEVFVNIGLMPDGGGTFTLPQIVGLGRAFEMIYEGRIIGAEEAERIGLLNHVFPVESFADDVHAYARKLAAGPPLAYARAKAALQAAAGDLGAALDRERHGQLDLIASADHAEGVAAFLEKRRPTFQGR